MPVWLVTGGSGFLGGHLLDVLHEQETSRTIIWASGRRRIRGWPDRTFFSADLTHPRSVREMVRAVQPDMVVHLAGGTPPAAAGELYQANTVATALLLDALRERGQPVRVVLAGSAAELGPVPEADLPVGEAYPCRPLGEYGLSKLLATAAALAARPPLEVVVGRIFNPIGPGTPESQAIGRFAARLADPGTRRLTVGSLDARRDFIDVRDVARALRALAVRGRAGMLYHVGTGRSHRVGDGLEYFARRRGLPVALAVDPELRSRAGPDDSRADIRRIVEHTGWRPEIPWEQSLTDLWEEAVARPVLPLTA